MSAPLASPGERVNRVATLRPTMRGSMHRSAVPAAVCLAVLLAIRAPGAGARAALIVYAACVIAMLTVSAIYHSPRLAASERRRLRRLDHSTIMLAIAGTYTAVIVLAIDGTTRLVLLAVVWAIAAVGVTIRMFWLDAPPGLVAVVYLAAGWMLIVDPPAFLHGMSGVELGFLAAGGALYTAGAIVYALRRPNPWPASFGYHEVFHALVVAAALSHWLSIFLLAG